MLSKSLEEQREDLEALMEKRKLKRKRDILKHLKGCDIKEGLTTG